MVIIYDLVIMYVFSFFDDTLEENTYVGELRREYSGVSKSHNKTHMSIHTQEVVR